MYESYFGLEKKPFSLVSDSDFLFMGKTHSTAFAMLEYGVLSQAGFTVITGEVGSGKTTLIQHLLAELGHDVTVGLITNTNANMGALLPWVLHAFGQPYRDDNPVAQYDLFASFLEKQHESQKRAVLIVDEAQNLGGAVLEELRMLSNLNAREKQFLQIILVGQPELRQLLKEPVLLQFAQRVSADYHLVPLTPTETVSYIKHRLLKAGASKDVFTTRAYVLLHSLSHGLPRIINILCDTLMSYAYADEKRVIDDKYLKEVLKERASSGLLALGEETLRKVEELTRDQPNLDQLLAET